MAKGIKVVIHSAGARKILTSSRVASDLSRRAESIASRANSMVDDSDDGFVNDAYIADAGTGKGRARAWVSTGNTHGEWDNNQNNSLLKSLDAGR